MRRLTITFDVAFGKDEPEVEEEAEQQFDGASVSVTERRPEYDYSAPTIGFGSGLPWEDQ